MRALKRSVVRAFLQKKYGNSIGAIKKNIGAKSQGQAERQLGITTTLCAVGFDWPKEKS